MCKRVHRWLLLPICIIHLHVHTFSIHVYMLCNRTYISQSLVHYALMEIKGIFCGSVVILCSARGHKLNSFHMWQYLGYVDE